MNTITFVGDRSKTSDVKWHMHETWELIYCMSGQGVLRFRDGRMIPYSVGEMVAIPPNEVHANFCETCMHVNIQDPSFTYSDVFKVRDEIGSLQRAFTEAAVYYNSDRMKRELILASLGDLIASYLIAFCRSSKFSEPVEQLRSSILKNYTDPEFVLHEYIKSLPFHRDYLRKVFKKEMGVSPLEYMTSLRMKNAESLLSTIGANGYAIAEVAHMCGFENALYFSRVFKKYFGCSPSEFVKNQEERIDLDPGRVELME